MCSGAHSSPDVPSPPGSCPSCSCPNPWAPLPLTRRYRPRVHGCASSSWSPTPQVHPIGSQASPMGRSAETGQCSRSAHRPPLQLFSQPLSSFQRSSQVTHWSHRPHPCSHHRHHPRSQIRPRMGFLVQHPRQPPSGARTVETGNKALCPARRVPI